MIGGACLKTETSEQLVGLCDAVTFSSHFSFSFFLSSLYANYFFPLSLLSTSPNQQFTISSHLSHLCFTQHPFCFLLPSSTDSFTTFNLVTLNVPSFGKSWYLINFPIACMLFWPYNFFIKQNTSVSYLVSLLWDFPILAVSLPLWFSFRRLNNLSDISNRSDLLSQNQPGGALPAAPINTRTVSIFFPPRNILTACA